MADTSSPADQLLQLGWDEPGSSHLYRVAFGLTDEHIPALVQLGTDKERWIDWQEPESVGSMHALNALGQLRAWEHLPELLDFIDELDHDDLTGDWVNENLSDFYLSFGDEIGPVAKRELKRTERTPWFRAATAEALCKWAENSPERRAEVIDAILYELESRESPDVELNALLVAQLVDWKAVEAAPQIERAFAADRITKFLCGDWPEVQYQLGLGPEPPRRRWFSDLAPAISPTKSSLASNPKARAEERKAKRKAAKRARKRNRAGR